MANDRDVVLVEGVRTPFVKAGDKFSGVHPAELGRVAVHELIERSNLDVKTVDEVIMGNTGTPSDAVNISRVVALRAGIPENVPAVSVHRNCASALESITTGFERIRAGTCDVVISGGTENMSQMPMLMSKPFVGAFQKLMGAKSNGQRIAALMGLVNADFQQIKELMLTPPMASTPHKPRVAVVEGLTDPFVGINMGQTAEILSKEWDITRDDQDRFALHSHQKAVAAQKSGRLGEEITSVFLPPAYKEYVSNDIGPRDGLTLEQLGKLKPFFDKKYGSITVGNACPLTDGAGAVLLMSRKRAKELGHTPIASIRSYAFAGLEPERMGLGPAYATPIALKRAGLTLKDMGLIELNEAFAAQVIACMRALDSEKWCQEKLGQSRLGAIDPSILNVNGGAIALGHPVGTTGTRLVLTLMKEMKKRNVQFGLATLCIGGGQGGSVILERELKVSIQESLRIVPKGDIALLEWDLVGEKVNKLSAPMMTRLKEVVAELKGSTYKAVVMVSRKPKIFIAGADIQEIKKMSTKEEFSKAIAQAHEIFNALEDLRQVTIAAINGQCLGGGCEMVMTLDYRICADNKETKIGLPETKLGIIPGFGGCVRMPRIIGLPNALDIILQGKAVDGRKAEKMGLVDACVPEQQLEERAMKWAREKIDAGAKKRPKFYAAPNLPMKLMHTFVGRPVVFAQAKKGVLKVTKGFYPAQIKAIEVIAKTYGMTDRTRALKIEEDGFVEVATTPVSKNLIDLFFMMESVKKQTGVEGKDVQPLKVSNMAVLGAGTMGGGIAQVAADKGVHVRMKDINNDALALGFRHASEIFTKYLKRKKLTKHDYDAKMSLISGTLDYSGFQNMDVVVEAIVEIMDVKKKVISETAKHCRPDTIIASNTSSLSITEMADAHPHPENFVGMHFFNPVDKMPLVEVIRGPKTSDVATATIFELSKKMGKTPVVVKDGPGFLVNRLLMPYLIEIMFLLQDGMDIETVDRWYTHKFGMPMGPFRLMDEVGLDVCIKVVKIFHKSLGDRIEVPALLNALNDSKRLGKKNKRGFYLYDEKGRELSVDKSVYADLGLKAPTNPLTEQECLERGVFTMINEAALALIEDHIVNTAQDVDLAMIMGTGFPPFRGGLLKYADSLGTQYVAQQLEIYAAKSGARLKPSQPLANLAKTSRKFYASHPASNGAGGKGRNAEAGV